MISEPVSTSAQSQGWRSTTSNRSSAPTASYLSSATGPSAVPVTTVAFGRTTLLDATPLAARVITPRVRLYSTFPRQNLY